MLTQTYLKASNSVPYLLSYSSLALSYLPRPDGTFFKTSPETAVTSGKFARVPYILGDQEDEGTLFALFTSNISTTAQLSAYLKKYYFGNSAARVDDLLALYPNDLVSGSPFGTSVFNNVYPQFKRIAALLGDAVFTLTRRVVLQATANVAPTVPTWSYLGVYDRGTPILGTFHGSDLIQVFYGQLDNYAASATLLYFFNFAYNLDPNNGTGGATPQPGAGAGPLPTVPNWPQWSSGKKLVSFGANSFSLISDDFRQAAYQFIASNAQNLRF